MVIIMLINICIIYYEYISVRNNQLPGRPSPPSFQSGDELRPTYMYLFYVLYNPINRFFQGRMKN